MAIKIKSIPTLSNEVAEQFLARISKNEEKNARVIDFSEQAEIGRKILAKAKIYSEK